MLMKALKTFRSADIGRTVKMGTEFECGDGAARTYEKRGYAVAVNRAIPRGRVPLVENRAAQEGPLPSAGGETGGAEQPSSSPADQAQPTQDSTLLEGEAVSSASTSRGGSRRGRTSSTDATPRGGGSETELPDSRD